MTVSDYQSQLRRADLAGVYRLPRLEREQVVTAAKDCGYRVFAVDLSAVCDKAAMLAGIARAMAFPEWFGGNLDGLYDCLCDLSWQPAKGYLLLLDRCDGLGKAAEGDFLTVLDLLAQAAAEWRQRGIPFWCLADTSAEGLAPLPRVTEGK